MGIRDFWLGITRRAPAATRASLAPMEPTVARSTSTSALLDVDLAPDDPLVAHFQGAPGAVEVGKLHLESPALEQLRAKGVHLVVPLVAQGELVGLLNLGPRRSEQEFSADDRALLSNLASQAGPALRVAQLVRQQQAEASERERMAQELRVARIIQQTLLPKSVPALPGWQVAVHWQPARAVGGDFYDFLTLSDQRVGFFVGDVTDKGVPAAMVMATTRSILRAAAERELSPGKVLERANELLCPDIPQNMFVTCLYVILDPSTGGLEFANAGHNLPYRRGSDGLHELRATGMPLGLMPGMNYEQKEGFLERGETLLLYSDGLVEAHSPQREMFGVPRLEALMVDHTGGPGLIEHLLAELAGFTGQGWEQEDDVTLVALEREAAPSARSSPGGQPATGKPRAAGVELSQQGSTANPMATGAAAGGDSGGHSSSSAGSEKDEPRRLLGKFSLSSQTGNERQAMERVAELVQELGLPDDRFNRLKTAVAEATMNAIEHGNQNRPELLVEIEVLVSDRELAVRITDHGGGPVPSARAQPDLDAKLAGEQPPRGWGLFLIEKMVDEMRLAGDATHHTMELVLHR
ncbi:MAG TPA: SpoIIE family protein phosphatase [Anaerolineales bacterium]|nr:SpoIIE family protein phosphatase [Anaerolineales bacterium]